MVNSLVATTERDCTLSIMTVSQPNHPNYPLPRISTIRRPCPEHAHTLPTPAKQNTTQVSRSLLTCSVLAFCSLLNSPLTMLQLITPQVAIGQETNGVDVDQAASLFEAKRFTSRQRAMRRLWADFGQSRETVQQLSQSSDPEIANRARWILERWEIGMMPNLPESVQRKLAASQGRPSLAMVALLDGGYLREAIEVARHQVIHGTDEVRSQIATVITYRFTGIVHQAQQLDHLEQLLELLDLSAEQTPLVVARAILLQKLGQSVDSDNILPVCADRWSEARRHEVAAITWAVLGNFDEAAEIAEQAHRADLLSTIWLLAGRWPELAEVARDSTDPTMPVEVSVDQYVVWLIAAKEAGLEEQWMEAAEKIASANDRNAIRWRALAIAGQYENAITVVQELDPAAAADLMAARQDLEGAFAVLGVNPVDPQADLDRLIATAEETLGKKDDSRSTAVGVGEPLEQVLTAVRLLHAIGNHPKVAPALLKIAQLSDAEGSNSYARREASLLAIRIGRNDLIPDMVASEPDLFESELSRYLGFYLANHSPGFFASVGTALATVSPSSEPRQHVQELLDLVAGKLPVAWDRTDDLNALFDQLTELPDDAGDRIRRLRARGNLNLSVAITQKSFLIGDFFAKLGRGDLANRAYASAASTGDVASILHYADVLINSGQPEAAERWYALAYDDLQVNWTSGRFGFVEPHFHPVPSAASALLGQASALQRLGQSESAQSIMRSLALMPFNPIGDHGRDMLDRLSTLNQSETQIEVANYHLRFAAFARTSDSDFYSQAMEQAFRFEDHDPAKAALWERIAIIGSLNASNLYSSSYLAVPAHWHANDAIAAAQRSDSSSALSSMQKSLEYFPMNITMAEEDLIRVRDAGCPEVADTILDTIFKTGEEYLQQFPLDANATNNVAWVAAIYDRHLERATELSQHAVFLVPDSTSYRDTLAEILFRRGNGPAAAAIERQCLWDAPDQWHLHEQIVRFETEQHSPELAPPSQAP